MTGCLAGVASWEKQRSIINKRAMRVLIQAVQLQSLMVECHAEQQ